MAPNPFRHMLQARGGGRLALRLETRGWIEAVETSGLGPQERSVVGGNGRSLDLRAAAARGRAARGELHACGRSGRP